MGDQPAIIHVISSRATPAQIKDMASFYSSHIKLAVDIEKASWLAAGSGTPTASEPC